MSTHLSTRPFWEVFRQQMPVAQRWAYFDHAAVAPLSEPAQQAISAWSMEAAEQGDTVWPEWSRGIERVRRRSAELVGALPEEIALVSNTTTGICLVAEGLPWRQGDNVVTLADEFPSNLYPWLNLAARGVECRRLPTDRGRFDLDQLADLIDGHTRLVSLSWVGYSTGYRCNLRQVADIAHRRGALLMVDAIQGLGVFPIDVGQLGIDFLAADGHKWLLGPEGAGLLFIHGEHLETLRPLGVGWNSVTHAHDFTNAEMTLKNTAARYEGGSQNMVGMMALGASLELLLGLGIESIAERVLEVTDEACRRLERLGAEIVSHRDRGDGVDCRSGIVSFDLPGRSPQIVRQRALAQGVALACRAGHLRISPHAYCSMEDLDRLESVLRSEMLAGD